MAAREIDQPTIVQKPELYARGQILSDPEAEARKSTQGRLMVRERILALGKDSIYNLTGLVRAFPLDPEDLPSLENQFIFYTHFLGRAEELALKYTGASDQEFSAVMCNRVTSAMLAIMLGTLQRDDQVLSLVAKGRSHPSVQQAVELVGASFYEVQGIEALEEVIAQRPWKMLVITPLTPSKYHITAADVHRAITLAKERDSIVFVDDAHMMSRSIFYDEPTTLGLGDVDISVWSLDKHVPGPRGAAIVGRKELMEKVSAQAFQFGLEAQTGHYAAMVRGMEAFDPEPVRRAGALARDFFPASEIQIWRANLSSRSWCRTLSGGFCRGGLRASRKPRDLPGALRGVHHRLLPPFETLRRSHHTYYRVSWRGTNLPPDDASRWRSLWH